MQFINKNTKRKISSILPGKKRASPVPHLVKTNNPPSDSEIILVQDALLKAQEELEVLEYQLGSTTATNQDTLKKEQNSCQKFIRTHTAILSLIRCIPDDILVTIFEEVSFSPRAHHSHPPWAASQVCRNWRAIALSLPHLWKCIDLKLDAGTTHAHLTFLTNHLDRTKQVPLNVFVSSPYGVVHHPFIDLLCRYAERWGSVNLRVPGNTLRAFASVKGRLKTLHSLTLDLLSHGPYGGGTSLDTFEDAPELRRCVVSAPPLRLLLPWSQLLSYEDILNSSVRVSNALTSSSGLQRLVLNHERSSSNPVPLPTVTMNSLRYLSINFSQNSPRDNIPAGFLDGLTLPGLQELRFVNCGTPNTTILSTLIRRSHCTSLTSLEFAPTLRMFKPGELSEVLRLVPQLTTLVTFMPDLDDLRSLVFQGDSSTNLVPSLQKLILHSLDPIRRDRSHTMAALATSRCETTKPMYLRLVVHHLYNLYETHENLEAAFDPDGVMYTVTQKVETIKAANQLEGRIITLHSFRERPVKGGLWDRPYISKAMKDFESSMEELIVRLEKIVFDNRWEFHQAGLHIRLYYIVQVITREKDGQWKGFLHLKEPAQKLLSSWNELYISPFLKYRRWAFQGLHSFVYVPLSHESHKAFPRTLDMVYGKTFFENRYQSQDGVPAFLPSMLVYCD